MTLLAGAARIEITPEPGVELMGYAARVGGALAVHDPLHARAISLGIADHPEQSMLWVSADLCLIAREQAGKIRNEIAARTALHPRQIVVSVTHTHSGPDTGVASLVQEQPVPEHVPKLFDGLVQAAVEAHAQRRPARLAWGSAPCAIGRNRCRTDGAFDPSVRTLRIVDEDARPLAVVFHHGCHATVLGHDNRELSADWPGVASRRIEAETGAVALFLLGAHGDIDPRTRGLKDLAIRGQSHGLGFDAVEALGDELAEAVMSTLTDGVFVSGPIALAHDSVRVPLHLGDLSAAAAEDELRKRKQELAHLLELNEEDLPRSWELENFVREHAQCLPVAEARRRIALTRAYVRDKTAPFFVGGDRQLDLELGVFRIGDVMLLTLPLEATAAVGLDWRARLARLGVDGLVVSIANGWLRYLPHADDWAHPQSGQHYEVLASLLGPGSCESILQTAERLGERLS